MSRLKACEKFDGTSSTAPKMPSLEEIMERRKNPEAYSFFCFFFVRKVVGATQFKTCYESTRSISATVTESDEAFALCVLEGIWTGNNRQRLKKKTGQEQEDASLSPATVAQAVANQAEGTNVTVGAAGDDTIVCSTAERDAESEENASTCGASAQTTTTLAARKNKYTALPGELPELPHGGWTDAGVERYNEIQQEIVQERKNEAMVINFENYFAVHIEKLSGGRVTTKRQGKKRKRGPATETKDPIQVVLKQDVLW